MAVFENTTPVAIPDPGEVYSSISVSTYGESARVFFFVSVDIDHSWPVDLVITLIAPDGSEFLLHDQEESDEWRALIETYNRPDVLGTPMDGTWRLHIVDLWGGDDGTLNNWSIETAVGEGLYALTEDATADFVSPAFFAGQLSAMLSASADISGVASAVGSLAYTAAASLSATGLAGIDLISTARPRELYRCYIESAAEGEIEIPISSATMRQNAGGTGYVQVSMPDYRLVSALIARAADGKLRIDYVLEKEGREQATPFARTDAVTVTQERGSRNRSITITGTFALPAATPKNLPLDGVSYISDNGSTRRVRCSHNPRIAVGDTVTAEALGQGVVQSTVLTIGQNGKQFELTV